MKQRLIWAGSLLVVVLLMLVASCAPSATSVPKPSPATPTPPTSTTTTTTPTPSPPTSTPPTSTPRRPRATSGTLTKIDDKTLTLTTPQGPVTVDVTSDTTVQKITAGKLADLEEGQSLTVIGTQDTNGNVTTSIIIRPQGQGTPPTPPAGATRRGVSGTLTKIAGNSLTLTTAQGPVTVNVSPNVTLRWITTGMPSDLREGQSLIVLGPQDANGNITATVIIIQQQA